jgi:Ca2+-binding RTX toxin-like protein
VKKVESSDALEETGGADTIFSQGGENIVLGGIGGDTITITALVGTNIVLGDNGVVNVGGTIETRATVAGGADTILSQGGDNTILGGSDEDTITLGAGTNTVLGDNGTVVRVGGQVTRVSTDNAAGGADDEIVTRGGSNVIAGGLGGDLIDAAFGSNVVLGDNGVANFGHDGGWDIETDLASGGGADTILGGATNTILGGFGADRILLGGGTNTVLGDNGIVRRSGPGEISEVETTDTAAATGGDDFIRSDGGTNIILGGVGADAIHVAAGDNIVLGDNGSVFVGGTVSSDLTVPGGDDIITGGVESQPLALLAVASAGEVNNIIIGGYGDDEITLESGINTVLGDNGEVVREGGVVKIVRTTDTSDATGGVDTITSNGGVNVILGGVRGDFIFAPAGSNIILGDNGEVHLHNAGSNDVFTTDESLGGDDVIVGGVGNNIILGGAGIDTVTGGSGDDVILGDNGIVFRDHQHIVTGVVSDDEPGNVSGADILHGGDGDDVLWGGGGDDELHGDLGNDELHGQGGNDVIIGDVGQVFRTTNSEGKPRKDVLLLDVAAVTGEVLLTAAAGEAVVNSLIGADLVLLAGRTSAEAKALLLTRARDGDDLITGGGGDDSIFGQRGDDTLNGNAGNDFVSGGTGNDKAYGDEGDDTVVGDDAYVDSAAATMPNVTHGLLIGGDTVVPMLQIVPGGTPNAMVSVLPHAFNYAPADYKLGDLTAFASVVTGFGGHLGLVRGNDVLGGGAGNDHVIGDDQIVFARSIAFKTASVEALTRGLLDVADDFSDLIHRQDWVLDRHHHHHDDDHHDLVVDNTFTVGADRITGDDGNDVLIGDDSVLVEPTFTVQIGQTPDFERFVEGVADAGDELAHAVNDLVHLEHHLRDETVLVKHGKYSHEHVLHHIDALLFGNDNLAGGNGNDLIVGDKFELRTVAATIVPGGVAQKHSDDDAWKDADWRDHSPSDHHRHRHHHHHDHWQVHGLRVNADTISAGAGNDVVWGDSLALVSTTLTRGAGVSYKDFDHAKDHAEDAIERFATLTDSADYWFALQKEAGGDDISGGAGDDILFGQAGDDKVRGESGNDWVIGGDGHDHVDGGTGSDNTISGNESSSSLRAALAARLINWKDAFKGFGLPYLPFDGLNLGKGSGQNGSFDFLTFDKRPGRDDD